MILKTRNAHVPVQSPGTHSNVYTQVPLLNDSLLTSEIIADISIVLCGGVLLVYHEECYSSMVQRPASEGVLPSRSNNKQMYDVLIDMRQFADSHH